MADDGQHLVLAQLVGGWIHKSTCWTQTKVYHSNLRVVAGVMVCRNVDDGALCGEKSYPVG